MKHRVNGKILIDNICCFLNDKYDHNSNDSLEL